MCQQVEQNTRSLKKELEAIKPELDEMRKRKFERRNRFIEVLDKIHAISKEIYRSEEDNPHMRVIDESDLSLRRLEELQRQLLALEKEKVLPRQYTCSLQCKVSVTVLMNILL